MQPLGSELHAPRGKADPFYYSVKFMNHAGVWSLGRCGSVAGGSSHVRPSACQLKLTRGYNNYPPIVWVQLDRSIPIFSRNIVPVEILKIWRNNLGENS
jgi:hypothetical protein